jgi:hypothetical protein
MKDSGDENSDVFSATDVVPQRNQHHVCRLESQGLSTADMRGVEGRPGGIKWEAQVSGGGGRKSLVKVDSNEEEDQWVDTDLDADASEADAGTVHLSKR